jgi:hypothetical protein
VGKPKRKAGRPKALDEETHKLIVECIREGNHRCVAAAAGGISARSLTTWLSDGRKAARRGTDTPEARLYRDVRAGEAYAERVVVGHLIRAAEHDTRAMSFYLERKHPTRWGKRETVRQEVTGEKGGPVAVAVTGMGEKLVDMVLRRVEAETTVDDDGDAAE